MLGSLCSVRGWGKKTDTCGASLAAGMKAYDVICLSIKGRSAVLVVNCGWCQPGRCDDMNVGRDGLQKGLWVG